MHSRYSEDVSVEELPSLPDFAFFLRPGLADLLEEDEFLEEESLDLLDVFILEIDLCNLSILPPILETSRKRTPKAAPLNPDAIPDITSSVFTSP
ncbi:hypothetical protein GGQ02_003256 [Salinibacter ruber]|uniref:hypothetical protein n=1 Tax=Salinibacter ruber TaxID=146919 RepID=UPI0021692037|nr:hypothetical protein [Salinibacter ruber]MCS4034846.1 hypothetical protein [Salinibacter ruber]